MSLHLSARPGEIAETVLLPGDPLRAQWIAETYLEDVRCYNRIRGMLGFTGRFGNQQVSVQGSGMGIPSALIYYHELVADYGVKRLIRVGTAGALQEGLKLRDLVIAMSASTTSSVNRADFPHADFAPPADPELFLRATRAARERDIDYRAGHILSADLFYPSREGAYDIWKAHGVLCVEMETAGLYALAARTGVRALSLLTIADSLVTGERSPAADRERAFGTMAELALGLL